MDALQPERVARAMSEWGPAYSARICSPAEREEWGSEPLGVAACLAVKECLIKALGARPDPFSWHDLRTGGVACDNARALLADAGRALRAADGPAEFRVTGCAVSDRGLCGAALWGQKEDHILAIAVLLEEGSCAQHSSAKD
ncbi:hypothetical protein ITP53_14450 [Nonomuraea sp. K274]|uniref:4'-phosphopantetheinyl transferase superfamily protein n=1 Tax=Nonomuraea cypriaca TaxID=1187855 RepID=A0A931EWP1_9ACTN|nr:hypothetical protein [Nonomuraea cypriaca]MBF8186919.1 hypothetical protein [Nonomuraea cypriaca]